jgi:hypothetical protein
MLYIIADMNTPTEKSALEKIGHEIERIKRALLALGPMHPGSVSRQYQVCGKSGCKCMDDKNFQRHGPYHKLAYVHQGRPVCRFVRAECVADLSARLDTYKTFRALIDTWIELSIRQGVSDFFTPPKPKDAREKRAKVPKTRPRR